MTAFELSLKHQIGKLGLSVPLERLLEAEPDRLRARRLPLGYRTARMAGALPLHHRDPFDRLLIAQAQLEGLTLVTADAQISAYDVPVLW